MSLVTLVPIGLIPAADCAGQSPYFQVPPGPRTTVRGHIHIRNGLFHTYRERWGSGVTPTGAMLLSNLGYYAAAVGTTYLTGQPLPGGIQPPSTDDAVSPRELAAELAEEARFQQEKLSRLDDMQRRANDMLTKLGMAVAHPVDGASAAPSDGTATDTSGGRPGGSQQEPFTGQ
jgi:hypothetical protein